MFFSLAGMFHSGFGLPVYIAPSVCYAILQDIPQRARLATMCILEHSGIFSSI